MDIIFIPIGQIEKLKFGKVKQLAQSYSRIRPQVCETPEAKLLCFPFEYMSLGTLFNKLHITTACHSRGTELQNSQAWQFTYEETVPESLRCKVV